MADQERLKKPVEDKLKEFIKLARWEKNPSYFRLKEATEKSHRALLKIAKEYEAILNSSVQLEVFSKEPVDDSTALKNKEMTKKRSLYLVLII